MRLGLRRGLTAAAVGCVLLTGCSNAVTGSANPGAGEPTDVAAADFPITGADNGPVDQGVRNALTDLYTFWQKEFPANFGGNFQPLHGGVFSIDPSHFNPADYPDGAGCGSGPNDVKNNAFFCAGNGVPHSDAVTYDRVFLGKLADKSGRALVPVVLAHEFGHAIQYRFGFHGESINQETQADCFAGAWTRWVVDGNAQHVAIRAPDLDKVLQGYIGLRDPVGTDPGDSMAHGSFFDRASGFSEGYDGGVAKCRDNFGSDRVFTEVDSGPSGNGTSGNLPYDQAVDISEQTLAGFYQAVLPPLGTDFQAPQVKSFDGTAPDCGAMGSENRDIGYCADDKTVYFDEKDLTQPAYKLGDFAVTTAISLPYALAARDELHRSTNDEAATLSSVCLTGWYEAQVFNGNFDGVTISPGDIDEAVIFLLQYGTTDAVFPNTDLSGFELLQQYRGGFLQGGGPCDVGA
jgi:predicted metalloprotease